MRQNHFRRITLYTCIFTRLITNEWFIPSHLRLQIKSIYSIMIVRFFLTRLTKGQLIWKLFFGAFEFFQTTNENKSTWGIIVVKSNSFVRFLEETSAWKNYFDFVWRTANLCTKISFNLYFRSTCTGICSGAARLGAITGIIIGEYGNMGCQVYIEEIAKLDVFFD